MASGSRSTSLLVVNCVRASRRWFLKSREEPSSIELSCAVEASRWERVSAVVWSHCQENEARAPCNSSDTRCVLVWNTRSWTVSPTMTATGRRDGIDAWLRDDSGLRNSGSRVPRGCASGTWRVAAYAWSQSELREKSIIQGLSAVRQRLCVMEPQPGPAGTA